jgi:hypothetical protein
MITEAPLISLIAVFTTIITLIVRTVGKAYLQAHMEHVAVLRERIQREEVRDQAQIARETERDQRQVERDNAFIQAMNSVNSTMGVVAESLRSFEDRLDSALVGTKANGKQGY